MIPVLGPVDAVPLMCGNSRGVYSCTSNGALRLTKPGEDNSGPEAQLAALPSRLSEWRLTTKGDAFAYAGHEIELSIWDTERAFSSGLQDNSEGNKTSDSSETPSKKRKRNEQLLPGEIWRAKNVCRFRPFVLQSYN